MASAYLLHLPVQSLALRRCASGGRAALDPALSARPDVPHAVLEDLLAFASWAPSRTTASRGVSAMVTDAEVKKGLAEAMAERWRCDLEAGGAPARGDPTPHCASCARITGAAALILAALSMADMDALPRRAARPDRVDDGCAEYSAGLPKPAAGGPCLWAGRLLDCVAPLFAPEIVRQVLGLPQDWQPRG